MLRRSNLIQPLDYLRIEHVAKRRYDYVIPLFVGIPAAVWLIFSPAQINIFGPNGLVASINGLMQILVGFYIASLAAIATFNKQSMDLPMPGDTPTLETVERGRQFTIELTRRRFLCLMFGYLAFTSLIIYLVGVSATLSADSLKSIASKGSVSFLRGVFILLYVLVLANIVTTTLLGLYYMADRIHRHDPGDIGPNDKPVMEDDE